MHRTLHRAGGCRHPVQGNTIQLRTPSMEGSSIILMAALSGVLGGSFVAVSSPNSQPLNLLILPKNLFLPELDHGPPN